MKRKHNLANSSLQYRNLEDRLLLATLANGQELESSIAVGATETFEFQVAADGPVRVAVGELRGDRLAEPQLEVFDADGNQVAIDLSPDENSAAVSFTAVAGDYTIVVSDADNDEAMDFRVRALSLASDSQLIPNRDRVLQNGEQYDTRLDLGTFAVFPFEITTPGLTRFTAANFFFPGGGEELSLYDPNGQLIDTDTSSQFSDGSLVQFDATEAGTYTAIVNDLGYDRDMLFRVRVINQAGPFVIAVDGTDIAVENGVESNLVIRPGSFSAVDFSVDAPGQLVVSLRYTANSAFPQLVLFDHQGQPIEPIELPELVRADATVYVFDLDESQTGVLTGWVGGETNSWFSSVNVRTALLPGSIDPIVDRDGTLDLDTPVQATLRADETFSLFQLPISQLEPTRISIGLSEGSNQSPEVLIFDPDGEVVSRTGAYFLNAINNSLFLPELAGTYSVLVRHEDSTRQTESDLSFSISASQVLGAILFGDNEPNRIANGERVEGSLSAGGFAAFPFTVESPGQVFVSVLEVDPEIGPRPLVRLFGPDRNEIQLDLFQRSSGEDLDGFDLRLEAGEYTIVVDEEGFDADLDFQIRAVSLASAYDFVQGTDVSLDENGEEYEFSVPAGSFSLVQFDRAELGPTFVQVEPSVSFPFPEIFDSSGSFVGTLSRERMLPSGPPEQFTAVVRNTSSEAVTYQARQFAPLDPDWQRSEREVIVGNGQTNSFEAENDFGRFFTVPVVGDGQVWWSAEGNETITTVRVSLIRPDGTVSDLSGQGVQSGSFSAESGDGDYTVWIRDVADRFSEPGDLVNLTITWLDASDENIESLPDPLVHRQPLSVALPPNGHQFFPIEATETDAQVELRLTGANGDSAQLDVSVYDENGELVDEASVSTNEQFVSFVPSFVGTYYLVVSNPTDETIDGDLELVTDGFSPVILSTTRDGVDAEPVTSLPRPDLLQQVAFQFDRNVEVNLFEFRFRNIYEDFDEFIPGDAVSYDDQTFTATIDFSYRTEAVPAGDYRIEAPGDVVYAVENGQSLLADISLPVPVALVGDINQDGEVDILGDAFILVQNLGRNDGVSWSDGDLNGDGTVDVLGDAFQLVGNLGQSILPPSTALSVLGTDPLTSAELNFTRRSGQFNHRQQNPSHPNDAGGRWYLI